MMEVEMVRQRTVTKTTKELQRERRSNTTWQKEKTKTTREVIVRERTRKPVEKPQIYRQKVATPSEKQQKVRINTTRSKTVEKTRNPKEKLLMSTLIVALLGINSTQIMTIPSGCERGYKKCSRRV
ncbi:hypothetical protein TNIN_49301 [Trichonephila inaurata madagascariensis]|uniref:Uncharacterized protein n=1 Tax=Trichonephila inaurata madagascariensis TaxID=2747483 RepID=A0A8X7C424_9ARAC|nr:hypothetical protein TNIN_49301 [Trichonephila inaurata madagascariensis]